MTKTIPDIAWSAPLTVALVMMTIFPAWRFYSILAAQKKEMKKGRDWTASLWFSPILKNPQSFVMTGGASLSAAGLAIISKCASEGRNPFVGLFFLSFGLGALVGLVLFRIRNTETA